MEKTANKVAKIQIGKYLIEYLCGALRISLRFSAVKKTLKSNI